MSSKVDAAVVSSQLHALAQTIAPSDEYAAERLHTLGAQVAANDWSSLIHGTTRVSLDPASIEQNVSAHLRLVPPLLRRWMPAGWGAAALGALEWLRNILVFVPICLTWWQLSEAASNYLRTIDKRPDLRDVPFLLLWERGFEGQMTFSELASFDAALLALLVALSVLVHYSRDAIGNKADVTAAQVRAKLEHALWQVDQLLAPHRSQQDQMTERAHQLLLERADELLNSLAAERQRLTEIANERQRETGDLRISSEEIKKGAHVFSRSADKISQVLANLQQTSSALLLRLEKEEQQLAAILAAVENGAAVTSSSLETLQRAMGQIEHRFDETSLEMSHSIQAVQELLLALRDLSSVAQTLRDSDAGVRQAWVGLIDTTREWLTFRQTQTENEQATFRYSMAELTTLVAQLREALQSGSLHQSLQSVGEQTARLSQTLQVSARSLSDRISASEQALERYVSAFAGDGNGIQTLLESLVGQQTNFQSTLQGVLAACESTANNIDLQGKVQTNALQLLSDLKGTVERANEAIRDSIRAQQEGIASLQREVAQLASVQSIADQSLVNLCQDLRSVIGQFQQPVQGMPVEPADDHRPALLRRLLGIKR